MSEYWLKSLNENADFATFLWQNKGQFLFSVGKLHNTISSLWECRKNLNQILHCGNAETNLIESNAIH